MSRPSLTPTTSPAPRVIDVVFSRRAAPRRRPLALAAAVAVGLHLALWALAAATEPSLESWSAELAAKLHDELGREDEIEIQVPPAPPPAAAPAPPPPAAAAPPAVAHVAAAPPPPAQAGSIVAQEPAADEPVDLSAEAFVTGTASTYAGGTTSSSGTNPVAVQTSEVQPGAEPTLQPGEPDRSSPVQLDADGWQCAWPRAADDEPIYEQFVVLRVRVAKDGHALSANLVADPGHGFGAAAVACAMRTRFVSAKDRSGEPIDATSPPIRVRFTR